MTARNRGGRIDPDGRPPQVAGVGKNSKRHDLERPKTPGLHGSDLQQGDVQALEQGQRIAPAQRQERGQRGTPPTSRSREASSRSANIPDAIEFLGGRQGPEFNIPQAGRQIENHKALDWLPILRRLAVGPNASSALVSAFINQSRHLARAGGTPATIIDLGAIDDGIEAMLNESV